MTVSVMWALPGVARRRMPALIVLLCAVGGMLLPRATPARAAHGAIPGPRAGVGAAAPDQPDLGPNVYVFDPGMPTSQIQATVDAIAKQQADNEMGPQRYALLFKPGVYGTPAAPLNIQVGYYTEVAGLGASPGDVTINGHVDVYNRCLANNGASNCLALDNFWRSLSNLTIRVAGLSGCRASADFWAVSQAAPLRRVDITGGNLTLFDYCTAGPQYASGGFIADTRVASATINGSQQQFLVRDSAIGSWTNGVWNQVFSGVQGAPAQSFPNPPYTTLPASPVSREKPFLYVDASGHYNVFVPALRRDAAGTTWANGPAAGTSIPLERFYIARPTDTALTIDAALARGRNLLFTPGIYHLSGTIRLWHPDTVVLGLGLATLVPDTGVAAMTVPDVKGVKIAGLLFDAGPVNSPVLLQLGGPRAGGGQARAGNGGSDPADPSSVQDVFFRIGGATAGRATTSLVVNSDNVLLDDIWAWRADHGAGVGWTVNTADTGLIVNGDNVTAYGLAVEHYQKYEVIWNGDNGTDIFFQNEMPYDPPNQAAWKNGAMNGYAAFKVGDGVTHFRGYGMGSYCYFDVDPTVNAYHAFEAPTVPGVQFRDLLTISLNAGTITHVIDDAGATTPTNVVPVDLASYP